jgi:NTP pyrophosphatase (non-canonical NTP hydrolase)
MKLRDYATWVDSRVKDYVDLNYCVIALNEEAGEIAGWYKKGVLRKDSKFTDEELKLEVGDALFYLTKICLLKGWTLKEVMQANHDKLVERFGK